MSSFINKFLSPLKSAKEFLEAPSSNEPMENESEIVSLDSMVQPNKITYNSYFTSYSVKGKNPDTNRMKTVRFAIASTASVEEIQQKSGLLPPYEIEKTSADDASSAPTERQVAYAKRLGFSFPKDATCADATVFLTRREDGRSLCQPPIPEDILMQLIEREFCISAYTGLEEARRMYFHSLSQADQISYFAMKVYCGIKNKKYLWLDSAEPEERSLFNSFAQSVKEDKTFLNSFSRYSPEDIPFDAYELTKKLKAYHMAVEFFAKSFS